MTGFNHTLTGTIIALSIKEPLLIAPMAFLSHFILDSLPHFGNHPKLVPYNSIFKIYLTIEAVLCVAVLSTAIILSPENWFILIWGAAWATLPDFTWLLIKEAPRSVSWFFDFHNKIQWAERSYGWIFELVYLLFFGWILVLITS